MNDRDKSGDRTHDVPIARDSHKAAWTGPASTASLKDGEIDLPRTVWDLEYRRQVVEYLSFKTSHPGNADKPG